MDVGSPYSAICPTLDSEVLVALARTRKPMTGREIARLTGRTAHAGVQNALLRLARQGLVYREEAGRALLFSLNRDHLAAPAVAVLADMRAELMRRIRDAVALWDVQPLHASLFGSFVRGDGDTHSDIDLFVVRAAEVPEEDPRWRAQLDQLATQIERWTGNPARIAEVAEQEISRLRDRDRPIIRELRTDALVLSGANIPELLGEE